MKNLFTIFFFLSVVVSAQQKITLEQCQRLLETNYPLAQKANFYAQKGELDAETIKKAKLPNVNFNAQATYQSEVTQVPLSLPNMPSIEALNKDQYKATLDVQQLIYNGGLVDISAQLAQTKAKTSQQQAKVQLYQIKSKVNLAYMSVLLLQEQKDLLLSKKELLTTKIKQVQSGVKNGILLPSSDYVLQVEIIKVEQLLEENKLQKTKEINYLNQLIFADFTNDVELEKPFVLDTDAERPEWELFDLQTQQIDLAKNNLTKNRLPKLNAFGQVGYGNPGLNMLENSFQDFYMVGLKLNWNIWDWNTTKNQKKALNIEKEIISTEKENFRIQQNTQLTEAQFEIDKYQNYLNSDEELINLRKKY